jgi:hypothetical protein
MTPIASGQVCIHQPPLRLARLLLSHIELELAATYQQDTPIQRSLGHETTWWLTILAPELDYTAACLNKYIGQSLAMKNIRT